MRPGAGIGPQIAIVYRDGIREVVRVPRSKRVRGAAAPWVWRRVQADRLALAG